MDRIHPQQATIDVLQVELASLRAFYKANTIALLDEVTQKLADEGHQDLADQIGEVLMELEVRRHSDVVDLAQQRVLRR